MVEIIGHDEILAQLALECYRAGGVRKWAKDHNCSHSTVSRILKGTHPITDGIAKILNIVEVPVYYSIGEPAPTLKEIKEWAEPLSAEELIGKEDN